ncbi:MAG: T9SS type A sorting domain-containing protein [Flavobacteriaceae bacterium]|nr:T9SS type A sorting domain-containing protein [Flavobacteriaceae bacterium]
MYGTPVGGGGACSEENPNDFTFENGINCSSASPFMTANDLTVAIGQNFTLTNITASIFATPAAGITNVDVNFYSDAAGLPGAAFSSPQTAVIDGQTVIGTNFGLDVYEVEMHLATPVTFPGNAVTPTTYWIELSVTDGASSGSVYWVVTSSSAVGNPAALFDGGWTIFDPLFDGVYIWDGTCDPLGVADNTLGGFTYYPNPTNGLLSLKSVNNIETVSIFNLLGQKVMNANIGATTSDLDISGLKTGTYLMQVTVDGQTGTFKVLKN